MYYNRYINPAPSIRGSFVNDYHTRGDFHYNNYPQNQFYHQNPQQQQRNSSFHHQIENQRSGPSRKSQNHREQKLDPEKRIFNQNPNPNHDDYRSYICPGCSLHFDCLSRNNRYTGRVPLILNCDHTVCQECIYKGALADNIRCPICKQTSELTKKHQIDNVQEAFTPNYYLVGLILWSKPQGNNYRQLMLVPSQVIARNKKLNSMEEARASVADTGETCCFLSCNKMAVLRCQDCNDVYCVECNTAVHKSAKSLWCHIQVQIAKDQFSVELEKCPSHNMDVEIFCRTCAAGACCYCFLEKHEGHERDYLTKLDDKEQSEVQIYKEKAEKILKQLLISKKKLKTLSSNNTSAVERKICSYFTDLHAKFYAIQKKLEKQVANLENVDKTDSSLDPIRSSIEKSIDTTKNILISFEAMNQKKINLRGLLQKLREIQDTPCYLLTDQDTGADAVRFEVDPVLGEIEDLFKIKKNDNCKYTLVREDQLPADYTVDPAYESDVESCISSLLGSCKKDEVKAPSVTSETLSLSFSSAKCSTQKRKKNENHLQLSAENEMVEVTHIESLECFYVQLKKLQSRFIQMNKDIDNYIKIGASTVDNPRINELYLAMYGTKKETIWCRGRITNIKTDGPKPVFEVFFIDYGSTQMLTVDKLREITPSLAHRKAFAIQCELYNPTYANWGKNAHVYMGKMINGKELFMMVKTITNGVYQVDLMVSSSDRGLTSIIDILIHTCSNALSTSSESSSVSSQRKEIFVPECKIFSNSIQFRKHQVENVVLANVIDPHHIFVHIASYVDALRKMTSEMKRHYKNVKSESCIPIEGTYVVVEYKDPIRGTWHRALVKKVDMNSTKAHVLLVDWGNNVTVPWSSIRILHDSFTRLECQAILVKLAHVEPYQNTSWSEKATFFLQKNLRCQEPLKMIVHSLNPLEVALFENCGASDICINAQLVEEKLADSTGKISQTLVWPQNEAGQPQFTEEDGFVATLLKKVDESMSDDSEDSEVTTLVKQPIEVVKVAGPDLIHIKFPHREQQEMTLHKELQIYYQKDRETKETWEVNEDCVVIYCDSYVRGKIVGKEGDKYRVNVYDKACETVLSKEKIFVCSNYFRTYPNVVFKSHLANIRPAGGDKWSLMSIEALERVFEKYKDIYATKVKGDASSKSIPMLMWYKQVEVRGALEPDVTKFVSINHLLVKTGFAYKVRAEDDETAAKVGEEVQGETVKLQVEAQVHASNAESLNVTASSEETVSCEEEGILMKSSDESKEKSSLNSSDPTNTSSSIMDWVELMENEEKMGTNHDSPYHTRETEIADWKPAFPIKKREFSAWITCAETEGYLYLRDEDLQQVYKDMEANLKQYFDSQPLAKKKSNWKPGQICTISYKDYWYRGKILKVNSPDEILAIMIDFGSDHVLSPDQLYREILYPEIPAFATRIKLAKLYAKSGMWLDSDYEALLAKITEYTKVVIEGPLEAETPLAEVYLSTGESINQILANMCPNLTRCLTSSEDSPDEDCVVIEKEEPLGETLNVDKDTETEIVDTTSMEFKIEPLPHNIELKERVRMPVVGVLAYNKVVLKHPQEDLEDLYNLSEKIQLSYAKQPILENIKTGMPCICPYSEDGVWYRGRVHNIDGIDCGYVFVFYVDFGNVESVSTKDIRMMRPEWFDLPVPCYIANINFELKTDNHIEHVYQHLKKLYEKFKLVEIVSKDPLTVNIYEDNGDLCYQSLVNSGLLKVK